MRSKIPTYPTDADVWADPRSAEILDCLNQNRRTLGRKPLAPLDPKDASTADVIRERLMEADKNARSMAWWKAKHAREGKL